MCCDAIKVTLDFFQDFSLFFHSHVQIIILQQQTDVVRLSKGKKPFLAMWIFRGNRLWVHRLWVHSVISHWDRIWALSVVYGFPGYRIWALLVVFGFPGDRIWANRVIIWRKSAILTVRVTTKIYMRCDRDVETIKTPEWCCITHYRCWVRTVVMDFQRKNSEKHNTVSLQVKSSHCCQVLKLKTDYTSQIPISQQPSVVTKSDWGRWNRKNQTNALH